MLREEELSVSPDDQLAHILNGGKRNGQGNCGGGREFSFIQNRVPSPLNNNFLLSEEQSRHMRQPSEGFMTAAHNLMNQDEFRMALIDQDQIAEEDIDDEENADLDGSKITLFTHDGQEGEDYKNQLMTLNTVQNTESNNDDFNYSESNYQYIASSSLGAIIQGSQGGGSFIGSTANMGGGIVIPNLNTRSSNPQRAYQNMSGRESATPFNYDENSLMNLSQTPTSVAMLMNRNSNATVTHNYQVNNKERIVSSTKLTHKQNSMVQILEEVRKEEEEQDESMIQIPPPSNFVRSSMKLQQMQQFQDQQDVWPGGKGKYNPLEMPLQRNSSHNPFSPPQQWGGHPILPNDNKVLSVKMDTNIRDQIFGRCKTEENEDTEIPYPFEANLLGGQQVFPFETYQHQYPNPNISSDPLDGGNTEDEIQMIKKKLDFSRLSSLQNLSQQQVYLNGPNSFLFQTYQSLSNKSLHNDTQHYSTCNLLMPQQTVTTIQAQLPPALNHKNGTEIDSAREGQSVGGTSGSLSSLQAPQRKAVPFEELLLEHMKTLSRNNEDQRLCKTYFSREANGCDSKQGLLGEDCYDRSSIGTIQQEPGINPPSYTHNAGNPNNQGTAQGNQNGLNANGATVTARPPLQQKGTSQAGVGGVNPAEKAAFQCHKENNSKKSQSSQREPNAPPVEIIQQNLMQQFQIDCINIYQNNAPAQSHTFNGEQQYPFAPPPPASRQNSNKVYSQQPHNTVHNYPLQQHQAQMISSHQPLSYDNHKQSHQQQHPQNQHQFIPTAYVKHPVTNKIRCQPLSDTPRDPSSIMIEETLNNIGYGGGSHLTMKMNRIQNQILQNHQQLGGFVYAQQPDIQVPFSQLPASLQMTQSLQSELGMGIGGYRVMGDEDDQAYLQHSEDDGEQAKQKVKLKKKMSSKQSRAGSKQRNSQQIGKQKTLGSSATQSVSAFPNNFMSKTMIISKEKINTAISSQKQSVIELPHHKSDSLALQNQIQFVQKYKQHQLQLKTKKTKSTGGGALINQAQTQCLNSGRSLPTSNQSSAQTSFLTVNAQVKKLAQKTTGKKIQQAASSKDTSTIEEKQVKKLKKKTKSVMRSQQLQSTQQVSSQPILSSMISASQTISPIVSAPITSAHASQASQGSHVISHPYDKMIAVEKTQAQKVERNLKCNTQRSLSRPKSGFGQEHQPITIQPGAIKFGKKKNSVIVSAPTSSHNSNKENIRPTSQVGGSLTQTQSNGTLPFKKSANLVGHQLSNRPEDLLQTLDNVKLLNGQDLLKEIFNQQQRMSAKNFQNLFNTLDTSNPDIGKRAKTEGDTNNNGIHVARSIEAINSSGGGEVDPYHMLTTLESQRTKKRPSLNKNVEIYNENTYKGANVSHQSASQLPNSSGQTNTMQKMQSPYNSKTMKNKFSSIKSKKSDQSSVATLISAKGLSNCSSVEQIGSGGMLDSSDAENNRRYNELIHLLKNTRFLAR